MPTARSLPSRDIGDGPVVWAAAGGVAGSRCGDVDRFLGIPYALPPLGTRRFAPAAAHPGWTGCRDATAFGPASAQVYDPKEASFADFGEAGEPRDWLGSEDSLTLNIWRPRQSGGALPVIVWIHGGANWLEASRLPIYDGANLARDGAVVVSLNYRLGIFGFLDLSPIGGPAAAHSHGLTDQLAAIEWVVRNIAAFGGDPQNLTLIGESAGAMDISWLLASGRLPGGVRRLVLMSGVASVVGLGWDGTASAHTPDEGRRRAAAFLAAAGLTDMAQLAAASTADILERCAAAGRHGSILFDMDTLFYPRTGGIARDDPFAAARTGAGAGLDVLIGFTDYELGLWLRWDEALDRRPPEWAAHAAPFLPDAARAALPGRYRAWFPDEPDAVLGMHLLGDLMFAMPSLWFADLLAAAGARVYAYRFDWRADPRLRALHAADQAFLFGHHATPAGEALLGAAIDQRGTRIRDDIERAMRRALQAFVRRGDPSVAGRPWPAWSARREMMLFDEETLVAADPMRTRREWWTANVLPRSLGGGQ